MPNPVFVSRTVAFGDCDPAGVVFTPRFSYFAIESIYAALDSWLGTPGLRTLLGFDVLPPVRAMAVEMLSPLTWDDQLNIKVSVARLGVHSFTFLVEGFHDQILAFTATVTHVCISPETREVVVVPEGLRVLLS